MKSHYIFTAFLAAGITLNSGAAFAQKFDSRVANPFIFCKAPKPCKVCQPFRAIHENICAGQSEASKKEEPNPVQPIPLLLPGESVPVKESESEIPDEHAKPRIRTITDVE